MSKEKNDPFNEFNWDEETTEVDFFGEVEKSVNSSKEEPEKEVETEKVKEEEKKVEEISDEEDDEAFKDLETFEDEDSKESLQEDDGTSENSTANIRDSIKHLVDIGLLELDEDEELPKNIDNDYLSSKIENTIEKKFEESIQDLPEEVKNIIKYVHNGGNLTDIISKVSESSNIDENIDMSEEANQEKVLKFLLKQDGEDDEVIEANIEFLKDSGKLASISQRRYNKWKENKEKEAQNLVEQQKRQRAIAKENQIKFKRDISEYLNEVEEIKGLSISKREAKELPDYISDTTIKLEDGRQITPFYKDLFEALRDKDKLVAIAKLVKNDFDFSDIKKNIVTKQTKNLKEDLQRQENRSPEKRSSQKKRLIDLI